jgi:hypothetical protein
VIIGSVFGLDLFKMVALAHPSVFFLERVGQAVLLSLKFWEEVQEFQIKHKNSSESIKLGPELRGWRAYLKLEIIWFW